jgi:hypothetical protein
MLPDGGVGKTIGNLTIQMIQSSASNNGYLSSGDWTTFNNKQNAITLTTTGTSGAATFSSGTLNIPQYQTALTNPVTGTSTSGYVSYWNSSSAITGSSNLFWDATNSRLGIGTDSPSASLDVRAANILLGATSKIVLAYDLGTSANSNSPELAFYGQSFSSITSIYGPSIQAINQDTFARKDLVFYQHNTADFTTKYEAMRLTRGGNLGIGTASPNERLHVSGNISVVSSSGNKIGFNTTDSFSALGTSVPQYGMAYGWSTQPLGLSGYYGLSFFTEGNERMRITATGNVGIGTSSPVTETGHTSLTINGSSISRIDQYVGGASIGLLFSSSSFTMLQTTGANPLLFGTSGAERMRITSAGNVGIGTTSPTGGGGASDRNFSVNAATGGAAFVTGMVNGTRYSSILTSTSSFVFETNAAIPILFNTNETERMRINANGDITFAQSRAIYTNASSGYVALYGNGGGLYMGGSISNQMLLTGGGNLLVGTTTDNGERLYVSGAIRATGNITANSDLVLKKNLTLVDNPIDKINQLNGYLYQWKENDEYQYGVIAQEVEKILPHAVLTGNNGIKGVAYNQLIPLLIEVAKEQNKKIIALEAKLG